VSTNRVLNAPAFDLAPDVDYDTPGNFSSYAADLEEVKVNPLD